MAPVAGAVDGVNERGLCITYDYGFAIDDAHGSGPPISASISAALERCSTTSEAINLIRSRPRWGGGLLMLADAEGDIASLELSTTCSEVRRPVAGEDILFHTNAFSTKPMQGVQVSADARFTRQAPPHCATSGRSNHRLGATPGSSSCFHNETASAGMS